MCVSVFVRACVDVCLAMFGYFWLCVGSFLFLFFLILCFCGSRLHKHSGEAVPCLPFLHICSKKTELLTKEVPSKHVNSCLAHRRHADCQLDGLFRAMFVCLQQK